jgi:indolepyruvate ferredoxin oxidoreductase
VKRAAHAAGPLAGGERFTEAVARSLYKLMSYKDEYKVARLYTDDRFEKALREQFEGGERPVFYLAPPILGRRDPVTGELRKQKFGPWVFSAFRVLARMKGLRGTAFDPFGRTEERRTERALIDEYISLVDKLTTELNADNLDAAAKVAGLAITIRGFGHVKERNLVAFRDKLAVELKKFEDLAHSNVPQAVSA